MGIARLMVREVGQREFAAYNGDYVDTDTDPGETYAMREGQRLTVEGNVEAFQVWLLFATKQRVWKLEDVSE